MDINVFAEKFKLKIRRSSEDGTSIIPGRKGVSHIYEYGDHLMAVLIMPESGSGHVWNAAKSAFIKAGMKICQNGDHEGAATFDPNNVQQVKLAMRYAGIRRPRPVSPKQAEALAKGRVARLRKTEKVFGQIGGFVAYNGDPLLDEVEAPPDPPPS
jgi:hypothetical protein